MITKISIFQISISNLDQSHDFWKFISKINCKISAGTVPVKMNSITFYHFCIVFTQVLCYQPVEKRLLLTDPDVIMNELTRLQLRISQQDAKIAVLENTVGKRCNILNWISPAHLFSSQYKIWYVKLNQLNTCFLFTVWDVTC